MYRLDVTDYIQCITRDFIDGSCSKRGMNEAVLFTKGVNYRT